MITTLLAILIMLGSALLILFHLRAIVQDTVDAIAHATSGGSVAQTLVPLLAFGALWFLIFALCYL